MEFSALQVYSPMSALPALLSFRQAVPRLNSSLQVALERTFPSALNQNTLISGVPPTWHFRHTASPVVTSIGSRDSTKYGGSAGTNSRDTVRRSLTPAGQSRYCIHTKTEYY